MYKNKTTAVKVGNEISSWIRIKSRLKPAHVLFLFMWIILKDFVSWRTQKVMEEHGIKLGGVAFSDLDYADDLSVKK